MFKVRASRREDSGYDLSYGKGGNKLSAVLLPKHGGWHIADLGNWQTKREALTAWGEWAAANYRGSGVAPTSLQPDAEGESPAGDVDPDAAAAHSDHADELTENIRLFFDTLSKKRGELTEYQRAQARLVLREIGWPGRNDKGKCPACGRGNDVKPQSGCSTGTCSPTPGGPPSYKVQAKPADDSSDADVAEPSVSNAESPDPADEPVEPAPGEVPAETTG